MSLVESAIKKLQQTKALGGARNSVPVPPAVRLGSPTGRWEAQGSDGAPVAPPTRIIIVSRDAIRQAGLLPPEHQERQIADQYRQVKRPLVAMALRTDLDPGSNAHLVMVTSAMPGDGKTFTAINLAISISRERDVTTLLVDADVIKPHVSHLFGVEHEPGLLDALGDASIDVESLILKTDIPGLSILPAGRKSETSAELLASQRMHDIAARLKDHDSKRIVIIDSSPLLLTNESRELAKIAGQIVVVVCSGKTLQKDLMDALSHLESTKSIGLVLNRSQTSRQGYYYGYGEQASPPAVD